MITFTGERSIFVNQHYHVTLWIHGIRKHMAFKTGLMFFGNPKYLYSNGKDTSSLFLE